MKLYFTKIKQTSENKIHLEYFEEKSNGQIDNYTFTSSDKPNPTFEIALLRLRKHLLDICEFSSTDEEIKKIVVKGVSFSYATENNIMGAVLTGQRSLKYSNCPLNINTPYKAEDIYNDAGNPDLLLPSACVIDLYKLIDEAKAYLEGDREQLDLFKQNTPELIESSSR
jgi:hypothetical protein